jgi:hypothetical protein
MNKEKFLKSGLLEQYLLGLTSPEENKIVEQYLQAFPEIQEEFRTMKRVMDSYVAGHIDSITINEPSLQGAFPSPNSPEYSDNNSSSLGSFNWPLTFTILFGILTFFLFQSKENKQQDVNVLEAEYAALAKYYDKDYQQKGLQLSMLSKIQDPRTASVVLTPTEPNDASFAVYHWNASRQESWLDVVQLPVLEKNQNYQVWAKVAGATTQLGTIPNGDHQIVKLPYPSDAQEIFITTENGEQPPASPTESEVILRCTLE